MEEESKIPQLLKQVNNLSLEREKYKELIEELRQANTLYMEEKNHFEEKLKARSAQLHKFAAQCQVNAHKIYAVEQTLTEFKCAFNDLELNESLLNKPSVTQMKAILQQKETELKTKM